MGCRVVVLISGSGSNLQAIIDGCSSGRVAAEVVAVISNQADAYGLERARQAGISAEVVSHRDHADRASFDAALAARIDAHGADLVVLAGFMRILTDDFVRRYQGRLVNIHPSLLPKYPGLHTHQRAIDAGDSEHGCSVHFVTPELDGGPVILQAKVPLFPGDDADTLRERVHVQEHAIYPLVVHWFGSGRLALTDAGVTLDGQLLPAAGYASDDE